MALIPLHDLNPVVHIKFQYVTVGIIAVSFAVFLWQTGLGPVEGPRAIYRFGTIPAVLFGERSLSPELAVVPAWLTILTSMFLHGGWLHLLGNMLFLWVFGDNVEDALGHRRFLLFYLLCGTIAAIAHAAANPGSILPTVGASGAISGVLGAYLMLHPTAKLLALLMIFVITVPAWLMLGLWIGLQVISAVSGSGGVAGGVAWWAHVGGFAAGALLVIPMRRRGVKLFGGLHTARAVSREMLRAPRRGHIPDAGPDWRRRH